MKKLWDRFRKKTSTENEGESPEFSSSHPSFEQAPSVISDVIEGTVLEGDHTREISAQEIPTQEISTQDIPMEQLTSAVPVDEDNTQTRLNRILNGHALKNSLGRVDFMAFVDKSARVIQGRGYAFYGKLFTVLLCTFFLADVLAIILGSRIPEPRASLPQLTARRPHTLEDFGIIMGRNLFSRKGLIPGEEAPSASGFDPGGAPVKTTLPFNLLGTVILRDEMRSIAAIEDKGAGIVYPVRVDEEIPGKARIVKVEPTRVTFVNTSANRREYVDLPEDAVVRGVNIATAGAASPGIEQVAANQFNIDRKEVDKALGDLNNILTQARAVPNFENGVAAGYKLFQIVPHSIYDQLGLKNGDVIAGIDGQPVTDPGKAFELLNSLKTRSNLELQVKRDGKTQTNSYDIH